MKRNPWVVALTIVGILLVIICTAIGAAMYTAFGDHEPVASSNSVLVMEVKGVITDSRQFIKTIERYRDDKEVKAIVVRLDSPGGVVGPSQEIYDEILRVRQSGKHVVASLGSVAASGAYYIAAACEKIVTNPGTITGSIGVIMEFANIGKLYEWAKVERYVVKSGPYKDIGSEFRPMTPQEKEIMQGMVDNVYSQFKRAVAKGRNMKIEQVSALADGRIYSGEQAVKNGLADSLGSLDDAVDDAAKLAGVKGKAEMFMAPKPHRHLWDMMNGNNDDDDDDLYGTSNVSSSVQSVSRQLDRILGLDLIGKPLFLMTGVR